ncbi:chemotaxis protein [Streptococcus sp. zg-JUN1979]|uniref:chemotaxis protein n=1 Tax=Streptococcus sp. zg-JUN1979 TaxID=3391450 RepID=UPI0039A60C1C
MKKGQSMLLATVAVASLTAYLGYKYRDSIKAGYQSSLDEINRSQNSVDRIKDNIAIIKEQGQRIKDYTAESTYKWRVFQQEITPKLTEIKNRLEHIKETTKGQSS